MVLEIDYQAAKRRLDEQAAYLDLLDATQIAARSFGAAGDVAVLAGLIALASGPMVEERKLVDEYGRAALARHMRTQVPYDQMLLQPCGEPL